MASVRPMVASSETAGKDPIPRLRYRPIGAWRNLGVWLFLAVYPAVLNRRLV